MTSLRLFLPNDYLVSFALFEAGAGFDLETFDSIFDKLSEDCTVIRYSRVGEGLSSQLSTELSAKNYAEIAKKLLDHLNIELPVIFVGHSYGGMIARHFADMFPNNTRALLLRADMLKSWVNEFSRGRFKSTSESGHFIHIEEPELVIAEFQKLLTN
jgi:pimeloyl-ACP methyl ester carboxylesterase